MSKEIKIIVHDGGQPAHTLKGIKNSIKEGAYGIEVDVQWTERRGFGRELVLADITQDITIDSPNLGEAFDLVKNTLEMIIIDRPGLLPEMTTEESWKIIQDKIIKMGLQNQVVFQFSNPDNLEKIDFPRVSLCRFDPVPTVRVPFYTLNPLGKSVRGMPTREEVEAIRKVGAEPIVCIMRYGSPELEERYYRQAIESEATYFMVDYISQFKNWLHANKIL